VPERGSFCWYGERFTNKGAVGDTSESSGVSSLIPMSVKLKTEDYFFLMILFPFPVVPIVLSLSAEYGLFHY
jgi:hypothetical protein